jgi:hypothetical protein
MDDTASSQPASDGTSGRQPGTSGPEWTRRNFVYGSAAVAAAMAFLRGGGGARPAGRQLPAGLAARARNVRPLQASGPYLIGTNAQSGSPVSVTVTTSTTVGDGIVVCISSNGNNSVQSVTDSAGNSYSLVTAELNAPTTIDGWIYACAKSTKQLVKKTPTAPAGTVTANFNGSAAHTVSVIGVPGSTGIDTSAHAYGTSAAPSVTTIPLAQANETLVAMEVNGSNSGVISWSNTPFTPIQIYGGGTITMLALSGDSNGKTPAGLMVAGGDVEGYFTTNNSNSDNAYGDNWSVANASLYGKYWRDCACIAWSQLEANTIYSCCGDALRGGGGFLVSTDKGSTWTLRSGASGEQPQFSGNHGASPMPNSGWPRSTGNLLAQYANPNQGGTSYMYAGSYSAGPYVCNSPASGWGSTWSPMFPTSGGVPVLPNGNGHTPYCRSLALDPSDPTTLFVATSPYSYDVNGNYGYVKANGYVWATSGANGAQSGSPKWTQLTGLPSVVEELFVTKTNVYAACGYYGIYFLPLAKLATALANPSYAWTSLNNSGNFLNAISSSLAPPAPGTSSASYWMTLAVYTNSSGIDVVIAFCDNPAGPETGGGFRNIVQITNPGSPVFTDLTSNTAANNVSSFPLGNGQFQNWWHAGANYDNWVGGGAFTNAHITIDQSKSKDSPFIYASGDNGFYRYDPNGNPYKWQLAINGLAVFSGRSVAVDPGSTQDSTAGIDPTKHVIFGDSDWCNWDIQDGIGVDARPSEPVAHQALEGFALAFDSASSVYLSAGTKYQNTGGDVFTHAASKTPFTWTSTGLATAISNYNSALAGSVARGLAAVKDSSTSIQYVLAAVETVGLFVMRNGVWDKAPASTVIAHNTQSTTYVPFATLPGYANAYALDRTVGVFRGTGFGTSWTASPIFSCNTNSDSRTGFLALNPNSTQPGNTDELWVSTIGQLYKITNANGANGGSPNPIPITPKTASGGTAFSNPGALAFTPDGTLYCIALGSSSNPNTQLWRSTDGGTTWENVSGPGTALATNASSPQNMAISPDGVVYIASGGNVLAYGTPAAGWTERQGGDLQVPPNQHAGAATQVVTSIAPVTATGTITSGTWLMCVVALKT